MSQDQCIAWFRLLFDKPDVMDPKLCDDLAFGTLYHSDAFNPFANSTTHLFLSGLFSVFGLTIFHTKMYYEKYQCYSFDIERLPSIACDAREVSIGWAIPLSWVGVVICVIAFGLWIFVTRAFRVIKSKTMIWYPGTFYRIVTSTLFSISPCRAPYLSVQGHYSVSPTFLKKIFFFLKNILCLFLQDLQIWM